MKKLLLVPVFLFAACGDNLEPGEDQVAPASGADQSGADTPESHGLFAHFTSTSYDCADHSVQLHAVYGYNDGSQLDNPVCRYELDDGRVFDTCDAVVSVPDAQHVVFTFTVPATGEVRTEEAIVKGPESFEVTLDATGFNFGSNQLAIGWYINSRYGTEIDVGQTAIDFDPIENVIIPDPEIFSTRFGPVSVTQPGIYKVTAYAWILLPDGGSCSGQAEKLVEVPACSSDVH